MILENSTDELNVIKVLSSGILICSLIHVLVFRFYI